MGLTSFPNGITSFGVPVMGSGTLIPVTTGSYFYVNSATTGNSLGSSGNDGKSPQSPVATVDQAIGLCTAGKGDVIIVMPGHAETVTATSIALDVAGVQIVGLGTGLKRPTFTYGAAAATITVSAANCSWSNCNFIANFASVAAAFTLSTAKDFTLDGNQFIDNANNLDFLSIVVTGASANAADGLTVTRNTYFSLPATANAFVSVLGNLARLLIADNYVDKAATNDAAQFLTIAALVITGARILRNHLTVIGSAGAGNPIFLSGSSTTNSGVVAYNFMYSLDVTAPLIASTGLKLSYFENYVPVAADKSGAILPAIA